MNTHNAKIKIKVSHNNVTGSNINCQVTTLNGITRFFIDKGYFYDCLEKEKNIDIESYKDIDGVVLTHAHFDHSGLCPNMINNGYKNKFYMSKETKKIAKLILEDGYKIMISNGSDYKYLTPECISKFIKKSKTVYIYDTFKINDVEFQFLPNAHVLGSNMVYMRTTTSKTNVHILFSGDYREKHPFLKNLSAKHFIKKNKIDVLFLEATYGNKPKHPDINDSLTKLKVEIEETLLKGKQVLIPVFSFDRTQTLMYYISKLQEESEVMRNIPVYLSGDLASDITDIYTECSDAFEIKSHEMIPYNFIFIDDKNQRSSVINDKKPKIILASSGQMHSGSITGILPTICADKDNKLITVGYIGNKVGKAILAADENTPVWYNGSNIYIKCKKVNIEGFSAHADSEQLFNLASYCKKYNPNLKIVLNHGDKEAKEKLKKYICDNNPDILEEDILIPNDSTKMVFDKYSLNSKSGKKIIEE